MNEEVDVSGCIFKVIRYCKIQTHILGDNARCDVNKKCYYKQLKRCEQKLEKIKEYVLNRMTGLACRHILSIIEGAEDE